MNRAEFLKEYNDLLQQASNAVDEHDLKKAKDLSNQAKDLEKKFNDDAVAMANQIALQGKTKLSDISDSAIPESDKRNSKIGHVIDMPKPEKANYRDAWAKHLMGKDLSNDEIKIYEDVNRKFFNDNSFSHTTVNTPTLVPQTVVEDIWSRAEENYPLWAQFQPYSVPGDLEINKQEEIVSGDSAWYDEATPTEDEQNKFTQFKLTGKELSKSITVSWKMKNMTLDDFIAYVENELAKHIGVALGYAAYNGDGVKQPTGIKTALNADEEGKKQIINYTGQITYKDMTTAIGQVYSAYGKTASIFTDNNTLWTQLVNITDKSGRPMFMPDPTGQHDGILFGKYVDIDAGITPGDVLIGDAYDGAKKNTREPLTITTETHAKARNDDYVGYSIVDAGVIDVTAFAILTTAVDAGGSSSGSGTK